MISDHDNIVTGKEIEFLKSVLNPSPRVAREIGLVKRLLKEGEASIQSGQKSGAWLEKLL
jgi:hypothetical protein